jgi:tetratricopeptide (TPR) repeat protein
MRRERLLPAMTESGRLAELIDLQTALAWDILHTLNPGVAITREQYRAQQATVRLDAFENYVKGVVASRTEEQIHYLQEAVRINPGYADALLQLGETYYRQHDAQQASLFLSRVPREDRKAIEANFYLGLAAYAEGNFTRAETALNLVAERLPLSEIYNNLGVVADHLDLKNALEFFQKAVDGDPNDGDYHFNLGVELYRTGDVAEASRQLRDALTLEPDDSGARMALEAMWSGNGAHMHGVVPASAKLPAVRIRVTYDESSFRQLALKINAAAEERLAKVDPRTHAQYHIDRGRQLLNQGFLPEAEREFREAVSLNPAGAEPHAGLADVLESENRPAEARSEAEQALHVRQFAEPLLLLARLDLRDHKTDAAAEELDRALRLEPDNAAAQALKRSLAAKLAQEAQPLPKR